MAVRNSLRTGLGLALAVVIVHLFPVENGFWVVLGAMSVLRSSALTTGTKMLRAVLGTGIGFVLGALLISVVGVDPQVLWMLMPIVVFGSAYVPEIASFTAGQAAFTMMVLIFFNLIVPTGWSVGLIRVQDVVVGALVGVMVSLLLWPRGATASAAAAVDSARAVFVRYLEAAVRRITRGDYEEMADRLATLSHDALASSRVADDAVRQYLSEGGGTTDFRGPIVRQVQPGDQGARGRGSDHGHPDPAPAGYVPEGARSAGVTRRRDLRSVLAGRHRAAVAADQRRVRGRAAVRGRRRRTRRSSAAMPLVTVAAAIGELELVYPRPADTELARRSVSARCAASARSAGWRRTCPR